MTGDDGRPLTSWPEPLTAATLDAYRAAGGRGEDETGRLGAAVAAYRAEGGIGNAEAEARQIILSCARDWSEWLLATTVEWRERNPRPAEPDYPPPRGWPEPCPGDPQ